MASQKPLHGHFDVAPALPQCIRHIPFRYGKAHPLHKFAEGSELGVKGGHIGGCCLAGTDRSLSARAPFEVSC